MTRRLLIGLLLLALTSVGLFGWLVSSESGLQWVIRQATPMLPGELRVARATGSMNDRILLHDVEFTQDSTRVRIDRIELRWNPWALWTGDIDIDSLVVERLEIDQSVPDAAAAETDALQLPTIALPLDISLQSMIVEQARYTRGEQSLALDRVTLAATLEGSQLRIGQLRLEAAQPVGQAPDLQAFELQLDGAIRLAGNYAHDVTAAWQMRLAGDELWQNDTRVAGDLDATELTHRARGPIQGQLALRLQTPFERLRWQLDTDIESFDTRRLDQNLPVASGRLELSATGDAEKAQARGRLDADAADVGQFDARFELSSLDPSRIADGVQIDSLEVAIYDGQLAAQGQVYWSPSLAWTLQLEASDIDPAARFAEWPGRVSARLASSGQQGETGLDARAEISDASGRLRDYPFTLQGKLRWFDEGLEIDAARLTSGSTRAEANGRIGEAFDLDWSLHSDQLAELYPAAAGQLSASGRLAGERSAPIVEAKFSGRGLAVERFSAASVDGEITLDLLNWQQLNIQLDARDLYLRGQPLQTLTVAGNQRRLDASLTAPDLTATLALQGALVENGWQGRLASASIDSAEFDDWRLQAPAELGYVDKTFTLALACLQSKRQSRICAQLRDAGGETRVGLDLARVPLGLLRRWMPPDLVVEGAVDATAAFTLRAGERPLGTLDAKLSSARASYRLDERVERLDFDAIEFSLALDADQASAAASARRDNGDRVQASIALPGANILELDREQQALQATLRVDARDWGILDRLLVQVENLGGHLRADLDIDGTLANPRLYGNATLDDGSVDIPAQALGFERIKASLHSERAQPARIEIDAEAAGGDIGLRARSSQPLAIDPLCLATSQAPQSCSNLLQADASWNIELALKRMPLSLLERWTAAGLEFDGVVDADADLEYQNQGRLLGTVDASLPAASASFAYDVDSEQKSESLQYRSGRLQLALGAQQASVDGELTLQNGDRLDTRIVLPGADLLNLDLQHQPLRGQIRVDARDWTLLDAMLSQVANLQGILRADLEVDGSLGAPRVQGQATIEQGSIDLLQSRMHLERINLRARSDGPERVRYDAEAATAGGTIALSGITLLQRDADWETSLDLSGDGLDIATLIAQWIEQPLQVDGRMQAQASLRYRAPDRLLGDVRLSSSQGELAYPLLEREAESWRYHDASLHLELGEQGISARSALRIGSDNTLEAALDLPGAKLLALDPEQQDLGGRASLYFTELGLVQHLLPEVDRMQGELTLGLEFAGKLASPLLLADARMQGASFTIPRLGLQIEAIDLRGQSDAQNRFNFELSARSGEGSLAVTGSSLLDAARGWPTSIQVRGENFEVSKIPEAHVNVSPDLAVSVERREILVEGDVLLPYAKLQPRDISTAARVSNDTVVIGMEKPVEERWLVTTRVNVILGDRVTFFGFGFEGKLGGRLRIDDAPGQLSVGTGEITIPEGRYRAYGQRLDIENGRLLFTGSALDNPGLDVRAIRRVNDIVVGLQLRGRVKQPELELFSIPPMGQTDTLSYLILGRPMEGASESEGEMVAKAALALGLAGGDTIARRLGDQFGLDEVRVESSDDGDQASLVVGRYLSPRLYVSYGVGLIESINSLRLRYELTERWKVQAESGEEHGADLLFSIER